MARASRARSGIVVPDSAKLEAPNCNRNCVQPLFAQFNLDSHRLHARILADEDCIHSATSRRPEQQASLRRNNLPYKPSLAVLCLIKSRCMF